VKEEEGGRRRRGRKQRIKKMAREIGKGKWI